MSLATMKKLASAALLIGIGLAACSRGNPAPPGGASAPAPSASPDAEEAPELGSVMAQVGRRFELAGRAMVANRVELAEFEVGELGELFENDVPRAKLPKEGPTGQIRPMAKAFGESVPADLAKAAASKDKAKFATAFAGAAAQCNACHAAAAKGFIQVPTVPGKEVPVMDVVTEGAGK
jgi:hypothetical protein